MRAGAPANGGRAVPVNLRWRLFWLLTYPLAKAIFGLRVAGREHLAGGPQILAANHVSNFDPLVVGWAAAREVHFLAKEELFLQSRAFAALIRSWNAHPLRRGEADAGALKQCSRLLRSGETLVLFPEGTRSKTGEMRKFKPGIGMLAITNGVPVVPVRICGMERTLISHWVDRDFVRLGFRVRPAMLATIRVLFGEPVSPVGYSHDRSGYEGLADEVDGRVRKLGTCHG